MLWKIAHDFHKVHGDVYGTPDDLFSETYLAFVKAYESYCPEKAEFTTYVWWRARGHLLTRKRSLSKKIKTISMEGDITESRIDPIRTLITDLSTDAVILVRLALDPPAGLSKCMEGRKPHIVKRIIQQYLDGMRWPQDRIDHAFSELRDALS